MSNCEVFNLPLVVRLIDACCVRSLRSHIYVHCAHDLQECELHQVREVLRCVLHTIIFNRALGHVKPRDVDSELFDITYVNCNDLEVDARVEAKISEFCQFIERRPQEVAQLCLSFYEPRRRQLGWFGKRDERLYWEQWCVNICVVQPDIFTQDHHSLAYTNARSLRQSKLQGSVEELLTAIVRSVNDKKDHIPPVVSASTITFPFDISISGGSRSSFGLNTVKRMLLHASPPPVLS
eukprot:jgi/Chrzof1/7016/Cz02g07220.t1